MTGAEQQAQISFPTTEIGGSIKYSMGIANPFRTDTDNQTDPTIQPTIINSIQATVTGHGYRNHPPLGILGSGTDFPRPGGILITALG